MSRKTLARPPEQGQLPTSSLMFRRRDFGSSDQLHSWESSTPEAMDSDNEYTVVMGRRMKKRMRQMSSEQTSSNEREQQSFMVSYVPLTASHNLNSLSRQFLYEYFESVAPGQVNEIRINSRKNILTVDAKSSTVIEKLKTIPTLSGIPVRSFFTYGKESTTGVISDVDLDIKNVDLRKLLSSSVQILEIHRLGNSRCIKLVFASSTLPMTVKVGTKHARQRTIANRTWNPEHESVSGEGQEVHGGAFEPPKLYFSK
ncbi:hypothetical protein HPB49_002928 [Dermacentor silvarum]|uniref:Uncharacterized protein n=1 Tax=Dermacentor silvarum TaxID=543639 RepID=A0ACB8CPE5_DERSI|nr:hypothetical protein HPB49_002928 [Dermacentor silvarum]